MSRNAILCVCFAWAVVEACDSRAPSGGNVDGSGLDASRLDAERPDAAAAEATVDSAVDSAVSDAASVDGGDAMADSAFDAPTRALVPNDLAILFPLDRGDLWSAEIAGVTQYFVSEINATRFPGYSGHLFPFVAAEAQHATLRVVAVRIAPCAPTDGCGAELRFVLQSLATRGFRDGALHASYLIDTQRYADLRADIVELSRLSPENTSTTVGVSQALLAQGMSGRYATELRARLLRQRAFSGLHRLTFMSRTDAREGQWEFGGLDVRNGGVVGRTSIAGFPSAYLEMVSDTSFAYQLTFNGSSTVVPHPDSAMASALDVFALSRADRPTRQSAFDALARRHNSSVITPETVDCASCHLSSPIRNHAALQGFVSTEAYTNEGSATRIVSATDADSSNLRMFGYHDATPVVSQRVANDAHLSLTRLNAR